MRENTEQRLARAKKIVRELQNRYPDAECALHHSTPLELLVATILSAQCTDARVNMVTPALFRKYPKAKDYAEADLGQLEELIQSTGFFRSKAKSLKGMGERLVREYHGEIPQNLEALTTLPGVGRKTANVVLGNAFGLTTGIVVDTHVKRLAFRMGLTKHTTPEKVEVDLCELIPKAHWILFSHWLISLGREVCQARRPRCAMCPVARLCPKKGVTTRN